MSVVHLNKGDEGYHALIWLFIHLWRAYFSLPRPCPEVDTNTVSVSEAGQGVPSAWSEHLDKSQGSRVASLRVLMVPLSQLMSDPGDGGLPGRAPCGDLLREVR
ncbi:unnamed protein product [Rangifer tarandus platyrhynchus]|uniref:Uncharacterized protein n=1 Tax=Rangifer tarandus platyrhynchus TaxID=3082113 RepID=A0ABN8Y9I7_RANTA|nr:unnamed protein product [Rangifer tarandus platyrhynchus]